VPAIQENAVMSDAARPAAGIPPDDPNRRLSVVEPNDPALRHIAIVGGTYTILLSGADTAGRYCLIDMLVPPGAGPGPHRHDFEEMFTLLEGEVAFTFRGETSVIKAGTTVNIPANAPHFFRNTGAETARLLCMCTPGRTGRVLRGARHARRHAHKPRAKTHRR
jgi:quercetin dioxygenase-like cupin family protein